MGRGACVIGQKSIAVGVSCRGCELSVTGVDDGDWSVSFGLLSTMVRIVSNTRSEHYRATCVARPLSSESSHTPASLRLSRWGWGYSAGLIWPLG